MDKYCVKNPQHYRRKCVASRNHENLKRHEILEILGDFKTSTSQESGSRHFSDSQGARRLHLTKGYPALSMMPSSFGMLKASSVSLSCSPLIFYPSIFFHVPSKCLSPSFPQSSFLPTNSSSCSLHLCLVLLSTQPPNRKLNDSLYPSFLITPGQHAVSSLLNVSPASSPLLPCQSKLPPTLNQKLPSSNLLHPLYRATKMIFLKYIFYLDPHLLKTHGCFPIAFIIKPTLSMSQSLIPCYSPLYFTSQTEPFAVPRTQSFTFSTCGSFSCPLLPPGQFLLLFTGMTSSVKFLQIQLSTFLLYTCITPCMSLS